MPELVEEESPNRGVQHVRQQNLRVHAGAHQEEAHSGAGILGRLSQVHGGLLQVDNNNYVKNIFATILKYFSSVR